MFWNVCSVDVVYFLVASKSQFIFEGWAVRMASLASFVRVSNLSHLKTISLSFVG